MTSKASNAHSGAQCPEGNKTIGETDMKMKKITGIRFEEQPRIGNRSDALELLDALIEADFTENIFLALEALKNAIEREII